MLAVLCEQDEIVEYILKEKEPNLGIRAGCYTAFHLSILTKDHKCFDLLLSTEYYQANIDLELLLDGVPHDDGQKTTALHSAISQKNYYVVYKLLHSPLPEIQFFSKSEESKEEGKEDNQEPEEKEHPEYQIANINQISCSGSTPLRIAAHIHDIKMVCLLYSLGDPDPWLPKSNRDDALNDPTSALGDVNQSKEKKTYPESARNEFAQIFAILDGNQDIVESTAQQVLSECGINEETQQEENDEENEDNENIDGESAPSQEQQGSSDIQSIAKEITEIGTNAQSSILSIGEVRTQLLDVISKIEQTLQEGHKPNQPIQETKSAKVLEPNTSIETGKVYRYQTNFVKEDINK